MIILKRSAVADSLFLLEVSMRPKRYPYSLTSEVLVDTSTIYAWDKPMYKMISFMNRFTGEIRVELSSYDIQES